MTAGMLLQFAQLAANANGLHNGVLQKKRGDTEGNLVNCQRRRHAFHHQRQMRTHPAQPHQEEDSGQYAPERR